MSNKTKNTAAPAITLDSNRVQYFPVSMLHVADDYNVRMFDPDNNAEDKRFVYQIVSEGKINTPLVCRIVTINGKQVIEVMQGHRRRAAVLYGLSKGLLRDSFPNLPVLGALEGMSDVDRAYDIGTSNSGKKLSAIENARLVARLVKMGEKAAKIAARLGLKGTKWVADLERMASMPDYLAEAVYAEHIAGTLAGDMIRESVVPSKAFDVAEVWAKASEEARKKSKYDPESGSYVWRVTQKHIDVVLDSMGKAMDKSRIPNRAPGGSQNQQEKQAADKQAADKQAADKQAADKQAADKQAADKPSKPSKPRYTIAPDGCTILDMNKVPLATCDNARVAAAILADMIASSRAEPIVVTHRAPVKMTEPELQAAQDAAARAESAATPEVTTAQEVPKVQPAARKQAAKQTRKAA